MAFVYAIQPLKSEYDRSVFSCGIEPLNRYLRERASQDVRKKASVVYVQLEDDGKTIAGYYTLASTSINVGELPAEQTKFLPKYPQVPSILIGRLARDLKYRGKGLGEHLLMDALNRSYQHSASVAAAVVLVDAKDASATAFYMKYGFTAFPDQPHRLFLMMTTIEKLYSQGG